MKNNMIYAGLLLSTLFISGCDFGSNTSSADSSMGEVISQDDPVAQAKIPDSNQQISTEDSAQEELTEVINPVENLHTEEEAQDPVTLGEELGEEVISSIFTPSQAVNVSVEGLESINTNENLEDPVL